MPQMAFGGGRLTLVWYDQRLDWVANNWGFDTWISDYIEDSDTSQLMRRTIDVWAAQADIDTYVSGQGPAWAYTQVSRYLHAFLLSPTGDLVAIMPVQFNCPNYPMFKGGVLPFIGDYIAVTPSPAFVVGENGTWKYNTESSDNPLFHVAWTDNRDVKPPLGAYGWTDYIPANSPQDSAYISPGRNACIGSPGNRPALRNQNVYTAKLTRGITAGSPANQKVLSLPSGEDRAFVVFVKNNTEVFRSFRMTIANQPPPLGDPERGRASFLQFNLKTELDVAIAPFSTLSRPVFVRSEDPRASVKVDIEETDAAGNIDPDGLKSFVFLNAETDGPGVPGEEETHDPAVYNPENPNIVNPNIVNWVCNPNIVNPNIVNPNIVNPNIVNPNIVNPNIVNPNIVNPNIVNPNIVNPNIVNPNIVNATPENLSITDVEWVVENTGNTATSYSLKTLAKKSPPEGVYTQLLVYREHTTPAVAGEDLGAYDACTLYEEPHHELLLNLTNPNIVNPNIVNPNIVNPNIVNAAIENATFTVGPGEKVRVTLRVLDEGITQGQAFIAETAGPSVQAFSTQEFIDSLGFAVTSQAVNSEDAAQGITTPPAAASLLVIATPSLPDGFAHQVYDVSLTAFGGDPPYTWSLTHGTMPPGLTLGSDGRITGIPTSVGTYVFNVKVEDSGSPFQEDTQRYTITIYAGATPDPLAILTPSPLPNAIQGTWYGVNIEATGGKWPRTWSLAGGSLPDGLSLDAGGLVSGTPTVTGSFSFTARVTDADGEFEKKTYGLTINPETNVFVTISGTVNDKNGLPLSGVTMRGLPNTPITDASGAYQDSVVLGWTGTVEPFLPGHTFTPATRTYTNIALPHKTGEDYNEVAVASQEWEARYDSGQANALDRVTAMTVDSDGNLYVTGYSAGTGTYDDVAVVKYDSEGQEEWVARYNSPGNYGDYPNDIAVDASGNVYVTGWTSDAQELHPNYLTVKFDSGGLRQWATTWTGPTRNTDRATAVAVDASGNVYVTGYSDTPGYNYDCITIKYNSAGHEVWVTRYDHTAHDFDAAYDIAVDTSGNAYIVGESYDPTAGRDFVTIKYDSSGTQQWARRHDGNNAWDRPTSLLLDDAGNVYVTGRSDSGTGTIDFATIKYNTDGDQLGSTAWHDNSGANDQPVGMVLRSGSLYVFGMTGEDFAAVRYDASSLTETMRTSYDSGGSDTAVAGVVDSVGNVYVTGRSDGSGGYYEFNTVKFDADGVLQWAVREDGPGNGDEVPAALVVDDSDNIIVAGRSHGGTSNDDFLTIQYNSGGSQNWLMTYNGPSNDEETGWLNKFLAQDPTTGHIVIAGTSVGPGTSSDFTAVWFDKDTGEFHEARYDGPGNYIDRVENMTVDSAGNVYLVGGTRNGQEADILTVKFAPNGNLAWAETYNGPAGGYDWANGVVVDGSGNVYVTGTSLASGTGQDLVTIMYDSGGTEQWAARYDGPDSSEDTGYGIAVDGSGNVYVCGESYGSTHYDFVTLKYDSGGTEQWAARYDGPEHSWDTASFIAVSSTGTDVYVCGDSRAHNGSDYTVIRYSTTDGSQSALARYDGGAGGLDWPLGFVLDAADNVYVTGMSEAPGTFRDAAMLKYDNELNFQWAARYDASLHSYDYGRELAVDSAGNVYVAGRTAETNRHADITTIKYDSSGHQVWIIKYNGPENESYDGGAGIVVDADGNVYVGGMSTGLLINENGFDWVVIKYKQ